MIDKALAIASPPGRDLLLVRRHAARARAPAGDLFSVKARGRRRARRLLAARRRAARRASNPDRQVVFFAIGFETTAPGQRHGGAPGAAAGPRRTSPCSSRTCSCRRPSRRSSSSPTNRVQGFLAAGHVCTVMGIGEYEPIAAQYRRARSWSPGSSRSTSCDGIRCACAQLEDGRAPRSRTPTRGSVQPRGQRAARRRCSSEVFEVVRPRSGAASATIPRSGWRPARRYADFDAEHRFDVGDDRASRESAACRSGEVLQGLIKPPECPAFGTRARPSTRSAPRWSRARAPAPPTTATGGSIGTAGEATPWRPIDIAGWTLPAARCADYDRIVHRPRRRRHARAPSSSSTSSCPAFGNAVLDAARTTPRSLDVRRRPAGLHHRHLRGAPAVLPGRRHRRAGRQRHRERPRHGRRARRCTSVAGVHPRGGLADRHASARIAERRWRGAAQRGRACASSPATPRSSSAGRATAATSTPPGIGVVPRRRRHRARAARGRATSSSSAAPIGDARHGRS